MNESAETRREALRRAALGAGALTLAGLAQPVAAAGQAPADEDLRDFLVEAIGLEQVTVLAYSTAADANGIEPALKRMLETFRAHEQAHADALRSALDGLGFDPPAAPDSADDTGVFDDVEGLSDEATEQLTGRLDDLAALDRAGTKQLLEYLAELEGEQLSLYVEDAPGLDSEDLSTTGAEIAGCQAQHMVVLGQELGDSPAEAIARASETAQKAAESAASATTEEDSDSSSSE